MDRAVKWIPLDVMVDILHYIKPIKLHNIASHSKNSREIVNKMDRGRYMRRWTYSKYLVNCAIYTLSEVKKNMEYELNNYWYCMLKLHNYTYPKMLKLMDKIGNRKLNLDLSETDIRDEDIVKLKGIYVVNMSKCKNITDKGLESGALTNVYYLDISFCENITHKSINRGALENVNTLNIYGCYKITDLSMLVNIHTLTVCNYKNTLDFSMLRGLNTLILSETMIDNMDNLCDVYNLTLTRYDKTLDVSGLTNVHTLNIYYCKTIVGLNKLVNLSVLEMYKCEQLNDLKALTTLGNLDYFVAPCMGILESQLFMLGYVRNIYIG